MRPELVLLTVTVFFVYNAYHDGKYTKLAMANKKYFQMGGIVAVSFLIYTALKSAPAQCMSLFRAANKCIQYMPVDRHASGVVSPALKYVSDMYAPGSQVLRSANAIAGGGYTNMNMNTMNMGGDGGRGGGGAAGGAASKRSVSGIKKKYVASNQGWKCDSCGSTLNAWFEVDHRTRLEHGGSNDVSNLVALCRECHGQKTTIESM